MESDCQVLKEFIQARMDRAREHLDELRRDVQSLQETDRARIVTQLGTDKTQVAINLVYRRPHPNRRWGALVGDFAHCIRSALDNTVYAIALTNADTLPPADDRILCFPIADTNDDWRRVKRSVRSLPSAVRAVIEAAQPCRGGNAVLSVLGSLNDMDKHRVPTAIAGSLAKAETVFHKPPQGEIVKVLALDGPAVTEAPLVVVSFSEPQTAKPDVTLKLASTIFLAQPSGPGGWIEAFKTLEQIEAEAKAVIDTLMPFIR
jgi:hypothetical protein